jgi:hypothetical protein
MNVRCTLTRIAVLCLALSIPVPLSLGLTANASAATLANTKVSKSKVKKGIKTKGKTKRIAKAVFKGVFHAGLRAVSPELDNAVRNLQTKPAKATKGSKKNGKSRGGSLFAKGGSRNATLSPLGP